MLKFPETPAELQASMAPMAQNQLSGMVSKRPALAEGDDMNKPKRSKMNAFAERLEKFSMKGSALKQRLDEDGSIMEKFTIGQRKDILQALCWHCVDEECLLEHLETDWISFCEIVKDKFNQKHMWTFKDKDFPIFYYNALLLGRSAFKSTDLTTLVMNDDFGKLKHEELIRKSMIKLYLDYEKRNVLEEFMCLPQMKEIEDVIVKGHHKLSAKDFELAIMREIKFWYWYKYHTDEELFLINHSLKYLIRELNENFGFNIPLNKLYEYLEKECPRVCNPKQVYNPLSIKKPNERPANSKFIFSIEACENAIKEADFLIEYTNREQHLKKDASSKHIVGRDALLRKSIKEFKKIVDSCI